MVATSRMMTIKNPNRIFFIFVPPFYKDPEHLSARCSLEHRSPSLGARELATGWLGSPDGQARVFRSGQAAGVWFI